MATGNYSKHSFSNHHSNKALLNVWVKVDFRNPVRFRIPDNGVLLELKVMMREELCDIFENVNPATIVVRNQKNEMISDLLPLKKFIENDNPDSRVGHSQQCPFLVDEPVCTVVGPFMEDVENEFEKICEQLQLPTKMKLQDYFDMSSNARVQWYSQISPYADHDLIKSLQATLRKAKQAALYGAKYKLKMNDCLLSKLPHSREDRAWLNIYHEEPYHLTKYEIEVIRDFVWPMLPPNFSTAAAQNNLAAGTIGSTVDHGIVNSLTAEIASLRAEVEARVRNTKLEQLKGVDAKAVSKRVP